MEAINRLSQDYDGIVTIQQTFRLNAGVVLITTEATQ